MSYEILKAEDPELYGPFMLCQARYYQQIFPKPDYAYCIFFCIMLRCYQIAPLAFSGAGGGDSLWRMLPRLLR